ncbi:alpha/beta hydrolase fold domain-containing protein [Qaidamihabitans albus]|uniref:alpha/beta hydrolase fold domain-containing protein n=1 Tax=Qaidamihabitans albus TaxID=2795733 RepID=UPI001F2E15DC|nr:alpha/beta hydrolase [Qaidamihabitans albus]
MTGGISMQALAFIVKLRLSRAKRTYADLDELYASIERSRRTDPARPPARVRREVSVSCTEVLGRPCYTFAPFARSSGRHVLYFHGGAYVHQIQNDHWWFLVRLVQRTGCTVTAPIYPLAPAHTCEQTVAMVKEAYDVFLGDRDPDQQVVMGDSAGAALTLALAESLEEAGRPQPKELVLISPWLDVTMTDPVLPELDRRDPHLAVAGLREAGWLYAGDRDRRDPVVSPLFGPLSALGRVSVFIGTRDVLLADARRLRELAEGRGVPIEYHEYQHMFHVWPIADIPEGRRAAERIAHLVTRPALS